MDAEMESPPFAERTDEGFILLARGILRSPTWQALTPEQKTIMITCLLKANHKETQWWDTYNKEFVTVQRGQFITSLRNLAKCCGKDITIKKVRTALVKLQNMQFLAYEGAQHYTIVTISNYGTYQEVSNYQRAQQRAQEGHSEGTPRATNNNDKNDKNINKEYVDLIWEHYQSLLQGLGKRKRKKTESKLKHINARLEDGFTVDEIKSVLDHAFNDEYMVKNDYLGIDNIMRNTEKVENRLARVQKNTGRIGVPPADKSNLGKRNDWM